MPTDPLAVVIHDWQETNRLLSTVRACGRAIRITLVTPYAAAETYGAGYLGALQARAEGEFPDIDFTLVVDCGDAAGYALACLRCGVRRLSMACEPEISARVAEIALQAGAAIVDRPADALHLAQALDKLLGSPG